MGKGQQDIVIGIITQETGHTYSQDWVPVRLVNWLQKHGAVCVPVSHRLSTKDLHKALRATNGLVLPGGGQAIDDNDDFIHSCQAALEWTSRQKSYPLLGICQGFQVLLFLVSGRHWRSIRTRVDAEDYPNIATAVDSGKRTKKFDIFDNHHFAVTPSSFARAGLDKFFQCMTLSKDRNGLEFVSSVRALDHPIIGTQFHPERMPVSQDNARVAKWLIDEAKKVHRTHALREFSWKLDGNRLVCAKMAP